MFRYVRMWGSTIGSCCAMLGLCWGLMDGFEPGVSDAPGS